MNNKRIPWNKGKHNEIKYMYYTDGVINYRIKETDTPPENTYRGRVVKWSDESKKKKSFATKVTKQLRYGDPNYNNMIKNKQTKVLNHGNENYNNRDKCKNTCIEKYGVDNVSKLNYVSERISNTLKGHYVSEETKNKISSARLGSHLSDEMLAQKIFNTNRTFHEKGLYKKHKTKPEIFIENYLVNLFGKSHVFYNYVDISRYPYKCDFYVDIEDLFIEVHAGWRHNIKPFNENDPWCIDELNRMKIESINKSGYLNAIYQWSDLDVRKLQCAINNNLNFVRLYPNDIYFINEKPRELLETLVNLYHPQDNQHPRLPIWK